MALQDTLQSVFEANTSLQTEERIAFFEKFKQQGIPTIKNEEWKFTNLNKLVNTPFQANQDSDSISDIDSLLIPGLKENRLVFINGILSEDNSSIDNSLPIEYSSLSKALENNEIKNLYAKIANKEGQPFIDLNAALASDGAYIKVPKNKHIESPIALYFINSAAQQDVVSTPHNLIVIEENAGAHIIEKVITIGENKSLTNIVTEIYQQKSSQLDYYKIQNDSPNASQINATLVEQEGNSVAYTHTFTLSGDIVRNNLQYSLNGERIESHMNGLYFVNGTTLVDNHTVADHKFPNCESHELYKGIIDDKARGVFNGKIFVRKDAQKTNAFQSNKNLLLSNDAIVNTKPQLEIWADDVSCSHGCTTGQLDENALFYMNARGIGKEKAKSLLLGAFAGEVVDRIKIESLREYMSNLIEDRLA